MYKWAEVHKFHLPQHGNTTKSSSGPYFCKDPSLFTGVGKMLEKALSDGLTDIFHGAKRLWCTQQMQEWDLYKLKGLGANQRTQARIMSDIYSSQDEILLQNGLAAADAESHFKAKLESLKPLCSDVVPGFHHWFETRQILGIECRFYTNALELKHKLQQKRMSDEHVPAEVVAVTHHLITWVKDFYLEEVHSMRGLGKYPLAPGYNRFQVDPVRWNRWGPERQAQHLESLSCHLTTSVIPLRIPKVGKDDKWKVQPKKKDTRDEDLGLLDLDRISGNNTSLYIKATQSSALKDCKDVSKVV
ncbi:hypothetical protein P5673_026559 [Acropora cervicornis]|uniref:Uncharacterized protein n=1 Tax=Acropora cervicornis TaxID=6130 RepID=A0AAD9UWN3_ACRCE|nr:hypothetical protein P5673_026559 [Acropora cervicornis]